MSINSPRVLSTVTLLSDEQILDETFESARTEEVFFCGYGHDFVIAFSTEDEAAATVAAQCPTCTALAPTFPKGEADPALTAPDFGTVTCLRTPRMVRESLAERTMRGLAVSAA